MHSNAQIELIAEIQTTRPRATAAIIVAMWVRGCGGKRRYERCQRMKNTAITIDRHCDTACLAAVDHNY